MRATYTQKFYQQQKIQQQLSKKYGYSIAENTLSLSKISQNTQKQIFINKAIKPLKIQANKPQMSPHHQRLNKQIAELEHEKKMRQRAQQRNEGQLNIIKMMNQRIKQYNYLIDHKHIKQKNSQATKRVLKLKDKTEAQQILQQINKNNQQLLKVEDIEKQLSINRHIAQLYRKYKQKMYDNGCQNHTSSRTPSQKQRRMYQTVITNRNIKNIEIKNKNKNKTLSSLVSQDRRRNNSECITSNGNARIKITHPNAEDSDENKNPILGEVNFQEPYINKEQIKKNNQLERRQQTNKQIIQMYRGKITAISNLKHKVRQQKHSKKLSKLKEQLKKQEIAPQQHNPFSQYVYKDRLHSAHHDEKLIQALKEKRRTQEQYFSTFLQKRNRKYKKPWGNKILIKYDSNQQAKQMLQGSSASVSPNKTQYFPNSTNNSFVKSKAGKTASFRVIPNNLSEEDKMLMQSMREEQNDPDIYETMCKNEKINLFLKANRRNIF